MKVLNLAAILLIGTSMYSCGSSSDQAANSDGFSAIEADLKSEFGDDAYYTELNISYDETIGNMISLTVTDDPESLKMNEWVQSQGAWKQTSEVTLEIPEGTKAADFMFQLNDKINLKQLGGLIEKSSADLTKEKSIENPKLSMAFISFPDNGDVSKAKYVVRLEPETGGTSFTYYYELNGDFIEMDY